MYDPERDIQRRIRRMRAGLCPLCGAPSQRKTVLCERCQARREEALKLRKSWALRNGKCIYCFHRDAIVDRGKVRHICEVCVQYHRRKAVAQ